MYTYAYAQPEEYHFSLDSVEAPLQVARWNAKHQLKPKTVLDLCAGCGVMGFEYFFHDPAIHELQFVEVQEIYFDYFFINKQTVLEDYRRKKGPELFVDPLFFMNLINYNSIESMDPWLGYFDLILCNPPYFRIGQGKESPSEFKNRCRFFIDATFLQLIDAVLFALAPTGSGFLLLRPLLDHGIDLERELWQRIAGRAEFEKVISIRGTDLIRIFNKL